MLLLVFGSHRGAARFRNGRDSTSVSEFTRLAHSVLWVSSAYRLSVCFSRFRAFLSCELSKMKAALNNIRESTTGTIVIPAEGDCEYWRCLTKEMSPQKRGAYGQMKKFLSFDVRLIRFWAHCFWIRVSRLRSSGSC